MSADATVVWDGSTGLFEASAKRVVGVLRNIQTRAAAGLGNVFGKVGGKKFARAASSVASGLAAVSTGLLVAGAAGVVAGIAFTVLASALRPFARAAIQQEQVERRLASVIRATGQAAGFSAAEMGKFASARQQVTLFGDEVTLQAQAVLATFKEIRGQAFERTIIAAQDLSTVLRSDLQSAVLQLGKALNDPVRHLGALQRSGVSFTDQQREQIKVLAESNRLFEAQAILLGAVEGQVKGASEAAAGGFGVFTRLGNVLGDIMESLGGIVLTVLIPLAEVLIPLFQFVAKILDAIERAVKATINLIGKLLGFKKPVEQLAKFLGIEPVGVEGVDIGGAQGAGGGIDSLTGLFNRIQGAALTDPTVRLQEQQLAEQKKTNQILTNSATGGQQFVPASSVGVYGA